MFINFELDGGRGSGEEDEEEEEENAEEALNKAQSLLEEEKKALLENHDLMAEVWVDFQCCVFPTYVCVRSAQNT